MLEIEFPRFGFTTPLFRFEVHLPVVATVHAEDPSHFCSFSIGALDHAMTIILVTVRAFAVTCESLHFCFGNVFAFHFVSLHFVLFHPPKSRPRAVILVRRRGLLSSFHSVLFHITLACCFVCFSFTVIQFFNSSARWPSPIFRVCLTLVYFCCRDFVC
jgi:hypothetical protein